MRQLTFWFEYASTYTWLTVARIDALARQRGVPVEWRPFLLSAILKQRGHLDGPFAEPVKARYMWRDLERRAARHGIAYRKPSVYPPNTLLTARIGTLAALQGWCEPFTREVFRLHWTEDVSLGTEDNLRRALQAVGKSPEQVLPAAQTDGNKQLLRAATDEAEALGVFGSPTFTVGEEVFWGDDRLDDALDFAAAGATAARA